MDRKRDDYYNKRSKIKENKNIPDDGDKQNNKSYKNMRRTITVIMIRTTTIKAINNDTNTKI